MKLKNNENGIYTTEKGDKIYQLSKEVTQIEIWILRPEKGQKMKR